jgi:lipid-A-disaccharide synthase
MRYYLIAGEASGDLHGSNLIAEIIKQDAQAQIRAWGGELMQAQGAELVKHYKELAFMGFVEVVKNLKTILRNINYCKQDILNYKPDVLVFIDYPGFNMRIAKWAKALGYKTIYYISPQIWAWKENRVHAIKRDVDQMICILPFEKAFYAKYNYPVHYVGHPLMEVIAKFKKNYVKPVNERPHVALLPGSRKQEIGVKLPIMLQVADGFTQCDFTIAQAPGLDADFYAPFIQGRKNIQLIQGETYKLLAKSEAALVTSGTATLETALIGTPEIVCYKGNNISYQIAKRIIKIKYISLVNLILDKPAVPELIQGELNVPNISEWLNKLLYHKPTRQAMLEQYANLQQALQQKQMASQLAASLITDFVKQN